jgi:D-alanyl-D-alanine-carboxypeptidase/D-alanyl-D-alanine-endopeptidase
MFHRLPLHVAFAPLGAILVCLSCATPGKPPAARASTVEPQRFDDPTRVSRIAAAARALEPKLVQTLDKSRAPGAAIGLVVDGQLVYFKGVGVREVVGSGPSGQTGAPDPALLVDEDTVFRIASMTKAFVSAAALRLRDEGLLSLDDPAEKYLPELRGLRYPTVDSPRITVRHLLSHASGLPEDNASADLRMPMTEAAFDELLSHGLTFSTAPGTQFEYANLGFALAARVVTRASGVRVQDYVTRELLGPLGMTATGWDGSRVPADHRARGYGRKDSGMPAEGLAKYRDDDAPHEEPMLADGAWAAIGGLWTSPRDYARWVAFQLAAWPPRDGPDEGPVRRASLRETQSLQRFVGVNASRDPKGELRVYGGGYGLGWGVSANCRFEQVITHSGGLPGYGSRVMLLPDRGVGVFTMTNLTYTSGASAGTELIEALDDQGLIPRRPQPVSPQLEAARAKVLSLLAHFDEAEAARSFDGEYQSYETFPALETRLAGLRAAHGACTPGTPGMPTSFQAENALRGHARLACERGGIEMVVTLTSDSPPRIQSLALKSALPPSARLVTLGERASALLSGWNEAAATELFPKADDRQDAKSAFAAAALEHGACQTPRPDLSDGTTTATFRLRCDRGDLNLKIDLQSAGAVVSKVDLSPADGGPRCPR